MPRDELDRYYTPLACARAIRAYLDVEFGVSPGQSVYEPSCGTGVFMQACREHGDLLVVGVDVDPDLDESLPSQFGQFVREDWCRYAITATRRTFTIGNPPFGGVNARGGRRPGDPPYIGAHHAIAATHVSSFTAMILPFSWRGTPTVVQQFGERLPHYMIPFAQRPFNEMREVAVYVWDYRKLKGETPPKRTVIMPAISWKTRKRAV